MTTVVACITTRGFRNKLTDPKVQIANLNCLGQLTRGKMEQDGLGIEIFVGSVTSEFKYFYELNDLPKSISSPSALYADDCCFWESGSNNEQLYHLCQTSLNSVAAWCTKWGFSASPSKSAAVFFTKSKTIAHKLTLCSSAIPLKKEYKYLGVIFQRNVASTSHVDYVHGKCLTRLNFLRMLKGTSWGASKRPLLSLNRTFIWLVIKYGMKAYFFSALSSVDPILKFQNEALCICTGAMKSTPLICLQHAYQEMPLHLRHKYLSLKLRAHLCTFSDHPALSVVTDSWNETFSDVAGFCSFNQMTKQMWPTDHFNASTLLLPQKNVWLIPRPTVDLHIQAYSRASNQIVILQAYLSHLHRHYAQHTHIYTDGSKTTSRAGCGMYVPQSGNKTSIGLNKCSSLFIAELYGIVTALYWIFSTKCRTSLIITDSLTALQTIQNVSWKKNPLITRACLLYFNLCWVHD